nr:hypothetical protein [Hassalia byssoidea]
MAQLEWAIYAIAAKVENLISHFGSVAAPTLKRRHYRTALY